MDTIQIRYGETVTLPLDAADLTATAADLYVGEAGQIYVLTKHISLTAGVGTFTLSATDTALPLGTYNYQINVTDGSGGVSKYPSPDSECADCGFPEFIVCEALDVQEVS